MSATVEEIEKTETGEETRNELLLDSLEIKGYRCFEHLTIEKLGRVNLIVGKNNVGKTALLEALWLYSKGTTWAKVLDLMNRILERRNEKEEPERTFDNKKQIYIGNRDEAGDYFRHLFFKRLKQNNSKFLISGNKPFIGTISSEGQIQSVEVDFNNSKLDVSSGNQYHRNFPDEVNAFFIKSEGINVNSLTQIWDDLILRNEEDEGINSLKIISERIMDLNFINYPRGSKNRVPVVRVEDIDERVPLSSLGEGMNRLLGIALALVNCKDGILLIDEIESGLHYSVLPDVWKLIFKTAKDLNVQVFATTHSSDCVKSFTQAAIDDEESDGMVIRLENKDGKIHAVNFNEDELETVERRNIEVR